MRTRTSARGLVGLAAACAVALVLSQALAGWHERQVSERVEKRAAAGDIVVYTTTECPYCAKARAWLNERDVPYTECNTTVDEACRAAFARLAAPGVPTLLVKGQRQVGFDPERVAQALER